jgi:hypothetical protein
MDAAGNGGGLAVADLPTAGTAVAEALTFYTGQSRITDPGPHVGLLRGLPRDVPALCRVVRGLILHPATAHLYGVVVPDDRLGEQDTRGIAAILTRILELDGAALTIPRPPERRFVGCCRDFSTLLCALLRHQGVPARARAGVATYFFPTFGVDHWVCEYWQPGAGEPGGDEPGDDPGDGGGRWVLVDAELDETHCAAYHIAFDPHDVPREAFLVAGEAWRRCRADEANPEWFGVAPDSPMRGWRYLQSQLVRDVASLNKTELLCWDVWGLAHAREETGDAGELALLDLLATLSLSVDGAVESAFGELRRLYESEPRLRVPPLITSFAAAGGWRTAQQVSLWPA